MTTEIRTDEAELTVPEGEWLAASARLTDAAAPLCGRDDVIVSIAPGAGQGAAACWLLQQAVIEIDGSRLECPPSGLTPALASSRATYAGTWGALCHEAAHVRYTLWLSEAGDIINSKPRKERRQWMAWGEAAKLLDESRIEYHYSWDRPWDTRWLRASAVRHVMDENAELQLIMGSKALAARAVALLVARGEAGILKWKQSNAVRALCVQALGADTVYKLLGIVRKAWRLADDYDAEAMLKLGREWCEAIPADPQAGEGGNVKGDDSSDGEGELAPSGGGDAGGNDADSEETGGKSKGKSDDKSKPGESGGGSGSGQSEESESEDEKDAGDSGDESEDDDTDEESGSAAGEDDAEGDSPERSDSDAEGGTEDDTGKFAEALAKELTKILDEIARDIADYAESEIRIEKGEDGSFKGAAEYKEAAAPPDEVQGAAKLAARLQQYVMPDVTQTPFSAPLPPGRLQMRQAMARSAQLSAGRMPTAEPWRQVRREYHPSPPLKVGLAVSNAGGSGCLRDIAASVAYRFRSAVETLPGSDTRLVTFGGKAQNVPYKPGIKAYTGTSDMRNVRERDGLLPQIEALDGMLALTRPGAGRLLIIVSDQTGTAGDTPELRRKMRELLDSGCRVLWFDCTIIHSGMSWSIPGMQHKRVPYDRLYQAVSMAEDELVAFMTARPDSGNELAGQYA